MKYGVEGIHYRMQDGKISYEEIEGRNKFGWTVCSDDLMNCKVVPINGNGMRRLRFRWNGGGMPLVRRQNLILWKISLFPQRGSTGN